MMKFSSFNSRILQKFSNRLISNTINNTTKCDLFSNGSVIYSKSRDIFVNLSLEDWIYRNIDLKNKTILLFWTNRPSIVIGRHQNPWTECHLKRCEEQDVCVVRRNSGGGTVYHDLNNLNLSFISDKKLYNRLNNLILIRNVLSEKFGIQSKVTEREDLVLSESGHKISGTASKVGAHNSYHHLTLLIDVDLNRMRQLIRKESDLIKSKATESIRSKTANLKSISTDIQLEDVLKEIALSFRTIQNCQTIDPIIAFNELITDSKQFNGIEDIENTFRSWQWIYGKTPRFSVNKEYFWENTLFSLEIQVFHGIIEKLITNKFKTNINLEGIKYTKQCVSNQLNQFINNNQNIDNFEIYLNKCIIECVEQTL